MTKKRKSYVNFPSQIMGARIAPDESYIEVETKDGYYKLKQDGEHFVREKICDKEKDSR